MSLREAINAALAQQTGDPINVSGALLTRFQARELEKKLALGERGKR